MKKLIAQHDYQIFTVKTLEMNINQQTGIFYQIAAPDWVNIIAFHKGQLIMEKQFRIGCECSTLELPGGIVEPGENIIKAAERELQEETGYKGTGQLIGTLLPNPAIQSNKCYTVLIAETVNTQQTTFDSFEDIETLLMSPAAVKSAILKGELQNALHIASLYQHNLIH